MSEIEFLTIKLSCEIYNGFTYKIPKNIASNMSGIDIVEEVKIYMSNFFNTHNLNYLSSHIKTVDFHIHDDIPYNRDILYMCDSSHGN